MPVAASTRLREAASLGDTHLVLRLLEEGATMLPDEHGRHALHLAASAGHADVVAALLLAGADVNVTDALGCTALQRAAADGHLEVVKQLIKHGANINHQDNMHGNTALHEASWKGFSRSVGVLSKARANLHLKNCGGFAALHLCCQNGHNQSCRELLLAGCNPDLQNNYGDTPLHTSARYGHAGVTRILISAQCHVSDQNKNGDTALHIAAAMGRRKLTRILLEAGCNKNLKNKQNETAKDIATRKDLNEILTILDATNTVKSKSKVFKTAKEKEPKNEKKREKNESGTSSKDSSSRQKEKKKHKNAHKVHFGKSGTTKQWSPYGCHYYPDPKAFPQPNLDSLPHEPLMKGEQYYLDLAGNIRKGPVGVGYTCYCAPFFRHMEERLDRDKRELKAHIDEARDRLDRKVSSLERRTQGQLTELSRRLARGAVGRHSERVPPPQRSPSPPPVPRARSLEDILDEHKVVRDRDRDLNRSFDALLDQPKPRPRHCDSSASSEAEEDDDDHGDGAQGGAEAATPDYENVDPAVWKKSVRQASDAIFLRGTRTAVYSPTHESDTHNDSGYSTKMYGSSKGPSPSLSGQLDVDARPPVASYAPPQKRAPVPLQRYNNQSCEDVVVAASLV